MHEEQKIKILKNVLGSYSRSGNEYLFACKRCNHTKKKLSINLDKNVWKCWICDYRGNNLGRLVKKYGSFLDRSSWEQFSNTVDITTSLENLFSLQEEVQEEILNPLPVEFVSLANKGLPLSAIQPKKYLLDRGLTQEDIVRWKIGFCKHGEYKNRIIIPSFNLDGKVNFFVSRTYVDEWPTYKNPPSSKDLIFNHLYVDFKNDLVLVEGAFDAIKATNAVPLLGSSLREDSALFQEIVRWDTTIFMALDPDAEKKATRLIKSLLSYGIEVYKVDITGYKDVGEMTKQEFEKRKRNATLMSDDNFFITQLSI